MEEVFLPQFSCLLQVNYHLQVECGFHEVWGIATHTCVCVHWRYLQGTCSSVEK